MYLINFLKSYFEWNPFILNGTNRSYSTERRVASRSAMSLHVMYKLSVHSLIHIYFSLLICLASSLPYCYFSQLLFFFSLFYHALSLYLLPFTFLLPIIVSIVTFVFSTINFLCLYPRSLFIFFFLFQSHSFCM